MLLFPPVLSSLSACFGVMLSVGRSKQREGSRKQRDFVVQLPGQGEGAEGRHVHDAGQETLPGVGGAQVKWRWRPGTLQQAISRVKTMHRAHCCGVWFHCQAQHQSAISCLKTIHLLLCVISFEGQAQQQQCYLILKTLLCRRFEIKHSSKCCLARRHGCCVISIGDQAQQCYLA